MRVPLAMGIRNKTRWAIRRASDIVTLKGVRRPWFLALTCPANLFQPHIDTSAARYPEIFCFLQREIEDETSARLLSFGCSVGDEVFSFENLLSESDHRRHRYKLGKYLGLSTTTTTSVR